MNGRRLSNQRRKVGNAGVCGHGARIVALTWLGVNAGCARPPITPIVEPVGWAQYLGTPSRAVSAEEMLPAPLTPRWEISIGKTTAGGIAVGEHVVAILSLDRHLTVVRRETGAPLWRRRLNAAGATGTLIIGSRILAGTGGPRGRVYSLDLNGGSVEWDAEVGPLLDPLAAASDRVIAATEGGGIVALDAATGLVHWRRALGGAVRTGPVVVDAFALVATDDSLMYLSLESGVTQVAVASHGATIAPPAMTDDAVIVASPDGYVIALARDNLRLRWKVAVRGAIFGSPAVARDTVFAVTVDGDLWAIPLGNPDGATAVSLNVVVRATPAPLAGGILVGTVTGTVLYAGLDGQPATAALQVDGAVEQQPILHRGTLLVVDGRGKVYAWQ